MVTRSTGHQSGAIFVSSGGSLIQLIVCVYLIMHLNSYQVYHWIVGRTFSMFSLHQPSSLPHRLHSRGRSNQIRQASCNHGRSCNWSWYSHPGDDSSYVYLFFLHPLTFFYLTENLQTTSFKVIVSTFSKIMAVSLPSIILGPCIPSFICHL